MPLFLTYYAQYYAHEKLVPHFVPSSGLITISQKLLKD